ncbi:FAD-binding oxidoreductase [Dyadobacter psychrotolerans]|uniref:FAD-binding oxidoreductase n=1 Tax=Dyadobacter psychrotolerans TaxID=2541721 RepID=A0A4R5DE96_9BACT|nr:FAD-binding oxidoreductase [Dyadobacter psychrotolerans]
MPDFDYLIVGHGIGGASIAWHLQKAGKTFKIAGDSTAPSSSLVAAGIFNPLTGKKLVKTWLADDLFPFATSFYSELESKLEAKFLYKTSVYRPYRSIEEQNTYLAQSAEPAIANYIGKSEDQDVVAEYVHMAHGGLEVVRAGWVDLPVLLKKSREYFSGSGQYIETKFNSEELKHSEAGVEWNGKKFGKVILCQGFEAVNNQYFNWLPFTPVKGQILEISSEHILKKHIINQGIFVLPTSDKTCKVGATYSWDPLDWETTKVAGDELEEKLKNLLKVPFRITAQAAGIRPSVRDRRPLIGVHPTLSNVCIFNGLGTKGVTLAPFFADQFVQHLENGKELNPLVNIQRYFSLYFH